MPNRFNRSNFLKSVIVDGKEEFDMTTNSINDFKFLREKTFYKIVEEDLIRPDLIAAKAYKSLSAMNYWWVVMYLNNIHDIWHDLNIGDELVIPNKKDLEDYLVFDRNKK